MQNLFWKRPLFIGLLLALIIILSPDSAACAENTIKMATTTSTENSGLLQHLLPLFEKATGTKVLVIAVGSGKALKLGENGDVDVVLAHSKPDELAFVQNGFGVDRRDVMYNDFVVIGPESDPAKVRGATAAKAFFRIASTQSPFISRGDESGTHKKELLIWQSLTISPAGSWYREAGQGMESVLMMALEKQCYVLTDRATLLSLGGKIDLPILCEGDSTLFNQYGITAVNPQRHPDIKYREAKALIEWMTSTEGQNLIANFNLNGKQLFFPNALEKEVGK